MKTEKEVAAKLKEVKKTQRETQKRFDKYDNHDDLVALGELDAVVNMLEWVLSV
jgi:predicted secreted Zn-dependent protease